MTALHHEALVVDLHNDLILLVDHFDRRGRPRPADAPESTQLRLDAVHVVEDRPRTPGADQPGRSQPDPATVPFQQPVRVSDSRPVSCWDTLDGVMSAAWATARTRIQRVEPAP
ncbi:hypothetical protein A7J05_02845 [Streptomyces alfalfae]|uniref:Uncharacterized protein n=1 Tax=Streptomyces alfalfae TaxID=1642299 RepID=A0ABM6GLM7_9ACTN|nr:hypothetical protein A7J05_02845 [Streptomyces alfalfae]